jgi:hypothetical protein
MKYLGELSRQVVEIEFISIEYFYLFPKRTQFPLKLKLFNLILIPFFKQLLNCYFSLPVLHPLQGLRLIGF